MPKPFVDFDIAWPLTKIFVEVSNLGAMLLTSTVHRLCFMFDILAQRNSKFDTFRSFKKIVEMRTKR
jgi:hypothetical protein